MELMLLLLVPLVAGLLCLATNSRAAWERLNLAAFALVAGLAFKLASDVASHGTISALNGFLGDCFGWLQSEARAQRRLGNKL